MAGGSSSAYMAPWRLEWQSSHIESLDVSSDGIIHKQVLEGICKSGPQSGENFSVEVTIPLLRALTALVSNDPIRFIDTARLTLGTIVTYSKI